MISENQIFINKTNLKKKDIKNKPYFPTEYALDIENSDVLFLPIEKFRTYDDAVFPEGTMLFFDYLKEKLSNKDLSLEICIKDEDYKELELHSFVERLAHIMLGAIAFPVVANLISNYLTQKWLDKKEDVDLEIKLTIEDKGLEVDYKGKAKDFDKVLKSVEKHLLKNKIDDNNDNR